MTVALGVCKPSRTIARQVRHLRGLASSLPSRRWSAQLRNRRRALRSAGSSRPLHQPDKHKSKNRGLFCLESGDSSGYDGDPRCDK